MTDQIAITFNGVKFTRIQNVKYGQYDWVSESGDITINEIDGIYYGTGFTTAELLTALALATASDEYNLAVNGVKWSYDTADRVWKSSPTVKGGIVKLLFPGYRLEIVDLDGTIIETRTIMNKTLKDCLRIASEMAEANYKKRCEYIKAWEGR